MNVALCTTEQRDAGYARIYRLCQGKNVECVLKISFALLCCLLTCLWITCNIKPACMCQEDQVVAGLAEFPSLAVLNHAHTSYVDP